MKQWNHNVLNASGIAAKVWAAALSLSLTALLHAAPDNTVPGRLLVKPREGIKESALQQLFTAHGAQQQSAIHQINVRILTVPEAARDHVLEALKHHRSIEFAEADSLVEPALAPNDPSYVSQWHLPKMQCPQAWDITTGSKNVIIAILDTGIEANHSDLAAKLIPGWNFYDNNSDTSDLNGHGTAVAGCAAAMGNNGTFVASPAWGCRIMPIRVSDPSGSGVISALAKGLTFAADNGARVANISYRVSAYSSVTSAAQYFLSKGGVVTVSSGNESTFDASQDNPYVLTVGATDKYDALASWSNTGNNLDVVAPGVNVLTTSKGNTYGWFSGTSASAPVAAGIAALVISANPLLSGAQVQDILKTTADDLGPTGWDPSYGRGRVNAYKAVLAATVGTLPPTDTTPPAATITSPSSGSTESGTVTIGVSASDNLRVTKVECYINGVLVGTSTNATGNFSWNTTGYANGPYTLQAKAYDAAGNSGSSASVGVSVQNAVVDLTAPNVSITAPAASSTLSGVVSVNVNATDNVGVTKVEWYLNGGLAGSSTGTTATFSWNTASCPNGPCNLQARAYDAAGNVGTSTTMSVTVQNVADTTPPTVRITSPSSGSTAVRTTKVYVTASDNLRVTRVDLKVDGKLYTTSTSTAPVFSWNTLKIARGSHTLEAVAYDAAGNAGHSAVVTLYK